MTIVGVVAVRFKGGPGSGNWGHAGRPGLVGGSSTVTVRGVARGMMLATLSRGWSKKEDRDGNNVYTTVKGPFKARVNSMDAQGSRWAVMIYKGDASVYGRKASSEEVALQRANEKLAELTGEG